MPNNDPGHKETDALLEKMEKQIHRVYKQAYEEAKDTADSFMKQFSTLDRKKREQLESGELTREEYDRWKRTQVFTGKRYQQMADTLAADMTNSNAIAASVINGYMPEVYAINHNYGTYEMEHGGRIDTSYTLYDRQTVERLMRDDPDLIPRKAAVNIPKDKLWNKQTINSAVTQGILQGQSNDDIAKRLASSLANISQVSAIRNARTMTTSAENGGRIDSYKRAESMGISVVQVWMATLDGRTRHEHRQLDGQKRKVGKAFKVDGYEIEFPGDPTAEPFLVYNCRCCLIGEVEGVDYNLSEVTERDNKLGSMTYEEWKEDKRKEEKETPAPAPAEVKPAPEPVKLGTDFFTESTTRAINKAFEGMDASTAKVYQEAIDAASKMKSEDGTAYNKNTDTINFNIEEFELMDSDTVIHETTHYLDFHTPMTYENRYMKRDWVRDEEGEVIFFEDGKPRKEEREVVTTYDTQSVTGWISFAYDSEDRVSDWERAASILGITKDTATPFGEVIQADDLEKRREKWNEWLKEKGMSLQDRPHVSDVLSSFLEGQFPFSFGWGGHDESYWNKDIRNQYSECLAAYSILKSRDSSAVECIEEICPNLYKLLEIGYKEMMKRV